MSYYNSKKRLRENRAIIRIKDNTAHGYRPVFLESLGDDTVGNPHRARISQFELFELILLLKLDKQLSIEEFEPTV